ncbi:MAG: M15 family metallopeptidase [Bacteroidales bacterium]|jgi:D-alanyl-D-alanine dipeptidase|nr:M15 family metallopeptidase [Bacteroidales bacterium]
MKLIRLKYWLIGLLFVLFSCNQVNTGQGIDEAFDGLDDAPEALMPAPEKLPKSETALYFESLGLVDVQSLDSSIFVDLKYAGEANFLKTNLYGDLKRAYLQADVAEKLVKASNLLQTEYPELRLLVWDAVRPLSVQQRMWDLCDVPLNRRHWYVSPPEKRSLHNFGAAVDVTVVTTDGKCLEMGTDFDHFSDTAYTVNEAELVKIGKISKIAHDNRLILRSVMNEAGFSSIDYEWWHFNSCSRNAAKSKYPLIFGLSKTKNN